MKMTSGERSALLARENSERTVFSLTPTWLCWMLAAVTSRTFAPVSLATAFANKVFPVPGGPYNRQPRILSAANIPYCSIPC